MAEVLAIVALAAALVAAALRRVPEAVVSVVGAGVLLAAGVLEPSAAEDEARALGPTLALLAALLLLGDGCRRAGLFEALGHRIAAAAGGRPVRLLGFVFAAAVVVTAVLGLDATVVLLTPAVLAAAARSELDPRPHAYACNHLANSASVLLPVSNLTNLLAYRATELSFARFALAMALPCAVAVAVEWAGIRAAFRRALATRGEVPGDGRGRLPRLPLVVIAAVLAGFVASSPLDVDPAWPAAIGALVLAAARWPGWGELLRAVDLPLILFVLGLGLIVRALTDGGLGELVDDLLPGGDALLAMLGAAGLAALLANLLNNVPALLVLLPAAAAAGPATVLAVLIGVNAGPNLTYTGSLATLLWRRVLHHHGEETGLAEFTRLGLITVPAILVLGTCALWLAWSL